MSDSIAELQVRLELEETRTKNERSAASLWRLSSCELSKEQLARFRALHRSPMFSRTRVEQLRQASAIAPAMPSLVERLVLQQVTLPEARISLPTPRWVRQVCLARQHFVTAIFIKSPSAGEEEQSFLTTWAFQSPYMLGLCRLRRRPLDLRITDDDGVDRVDDFWPHDFHVLDDFVYSDE